MPNKIVIIGGVAAGMSAASKARRKDREAIIEVYTDEKYISYGACGLPYFISGHIRKCEQLIARTPYQFKDQDIDVHIESRVTKISPDKKSIIVRDKDGEREVYYDKLVIATGSRALIPDFPGKDLKNVFSLRNISDGLKIKKALEDDVKKVVIVGGGYIGVELIESFKMLGLDVEVVEAGSQILGNIDPDMAKIVLDYVVSQGVKVNSNEKVVSLAGEGKIEKVITDKKEIPADMVILALGSIPNSEIAEEAGVELSVKKSIKVNEKMETNIKDIYSAGDCVASYNPLIDQDVYIPLGTTANKQGRIVGANITGGNKVFQGVIGTAITKIMSLGISRAGLSTEEARKYGFNFIESKVKAEDIAHYYPNSKPIVLKLIIDVDSHTLIGAQIIGEGHFPKRIDVMALAIQQRLKLEELVGLDMAYAPPYAPVWDPFLIATNNALEKLRK